DNIARYHPDVNYAESKKLYRNTGNGHFVDASQTQAAGFLAPKVGRGLAVGDYANDGWQSFLVNNNGEEAQLFRNTGASSPAAKTNHWLGVHSVGVKSNRDGTGAQIKVIAGDFTSYDQAKGGMSYCSAQDPRIYFGLGNHAKVDRLEIQWPSGTKQILTNIASDQIITVNEEQGITPYKFPPLRHK
ncbi:MAG: ASPIC/UnbV domain-containing protein, partial [Candidatus Acidiferrales bacterium]